MTYDLNKFPPISTPVKSTSIWLSLRRRWMVAIAVGATVFAGAGILTFKKTPTYKSEILILVNYNTAVPVTNTEGTDEQSTSEEKTEEISTEIQILQSRSLVSKALKRVPPIYSLPLDQVLTNLSIRQPQRAGILSVSYTDTNPMRVKAVLEALGETYVQYSSERKRSRATNAIRLIETQLPKTLRELNDASVAIRNFRERYGIVDPESYASAIAQTQQNLQQQAQEVRLAKEQTQKQYEELRRQLVEVSQNPVTVFSDAVLSQDSQYLKLLGQLQDIETQYAQDSIRFRENHPRLSDLRSRRAEITKLLQLQAQRVTDNKTSIAVGKKVVAGEIQQSLVKQLLQVQTNLAIQSARSQSISQAQKVAAKRFQQVPFLQQRYIRLQNQFKINSATVNQLLEKLQELRITEAQESSPWQVLEHAYIPTNSSSRDYKRNLALGAIAGLLSGAAVAHLLERSDRRLKNVDEVKQISDTLLLGTVPKVGLSTLRLKTTNKFSSRPERTPFVESFRSLAIVLLSLNAPKSLKTLAFISACTAEGKTTIVYNLATVLAEFGQRVLLVDANMYQPTIHYYFRHCNEFGLSTALTTNRPWRELIYSDDSHPKLDVMMAGPREHNPAALLTSEKLNLLLHEWKEVYDYILFDTPPLLGFTEAQSLAPKVDRAVLIAALGRSTQPLLARTIEILAVSQCHILGTIVNFLEKNDERFYQKPKTNFARLTATLEKNSPSFYSNSSSRIQKVWQNLLRIR